MAVSMRWRAALFSVGVLVLTGAVFFIGRIPAVKGPRNPLGYLILFVWFAVFMAYCYLGSAWLKTGPIRPVLERYRRRISVAMFAYCITLLGSIALLHNLHPRKPLLWLVAGAPAIPILGVLAVMGLYLREEQDELERAIHVEAMLWGLAVVLAVSTVWGFLSIANVAVAPPLFLVFPLFCLSWGISQPFIRRRYQ